MFANFETTKLVVDSIELTNVLILVVVLFLAIFSFRHNLKASQFLDRDQTTQLLGISILLVIVGHLWWHVAEDQPALILSGDAVAMFLLLSGYGLTISSNSRKPTLIYYISQRVKRVMIPYWVITFALILLDYFLLNKVYSFKDIILTSLGINLYDSLINIDYVRWYVTFLLVWYAIFFIVITKVKNSQRIAVLFALAGFIFVAEYYFAPFYWYQIFAFPAGCLIGHYYISIRKFIERYDRALAVFLPLLISYVVLYKIWIFEYAMEHLPFICVKLLNEFNSMMFSVALIILIFIMGSRKYYSSFLLFCGGLSYELFLLHGAFLVKYNPVIGSYDSLNILPAFFLFLLFVLVLAYTYKFCYRAICNVSFHKS